MGKSSPTRLQMKHVRYGSVLAVIRDLKIRQSYVNAYDVYAKFPDIPYKIIARKLERLIDAKIIEGCACGCSTAILVGLYKPLYEVYETYDEAKGGWTDTLRPVGWRELQKQRQRKQFAANVLNQIKEEYKRDDLS